MDSTEPNPTLRFEPDEKLSLLLTAGLGAQFALLSVGSIVITCVIVVRAGGGGETFMLWAVSAALMVSGLSTILQATRVGNIGAGYILIMGTSGAFIAVCVTAIAEGGPGMLATLIVISSLFQFLFATRLSLLRKILTPTVTGTVIMLIPVSVMPIIFDMLPKVTEGTSPVAAPTSALVTLLVILAVTFSSTGMLRLWAPIFGVIAGCIVGGFFGTYDIARIAEANWFGIPTGGWPGFDLSFGRVFWALLPGFMLATLVGAVETIGDAVAIQRVSWRKRRATNYREVQGAVSADGVGNLLSGLLGTVPNTTYSSSVALVELTGIAVRRVGVCIGLVFIILTFCPKVVAVILAIPDSVVAAYVILMLAMLFALGMRIIVEDGMTYRKAIIAGVAFWVGVGFQGGDIFAEMFSPRWAELLGNGMTAGGITGIILALSAELLGPRTKHIKTELSIDKLPEINRFLEAFATRIGWNGEQVGHLLLVGEETLLTLLQFGEPKPSGKVRRLLLKAKKDGNAAELEFIASGHEGNLEDRMALIGDSKDATLIEHQISLRLLRHFVSTVRHQQYHDADILMIRIDGSSRKASPPV